MNLKKNTVILAALVFATAASGDETAAAKECVAIEDASVRLACYDSAFNREIGSQEVVPPVAPVAPAAPVAAAPAEPRTMDDLGEQMDRQQKDESGELNVTGHVIRCERNASKKYLFFFEGGQVWRQANDKRLWFKDCDFNVTVMKDVWGYKMQIEGEEARIRISRIR